MIGLHPVSQRCQFNWLGSAGPFAHLKRTTDAAKKLACRRKGVEALAHPPGQSCKRGGVALPTGPAGLARIIRGVLAPNSWWIGGLAGLLPCVTVQNSDCSPSHRGGFWDVCSPRCSGAQQACVVIRGTSIQNPVRPSLHDRRANGWPAHCDCTSAGCLQRVRPHPRSHVQPVEEQCGCRNEMCGSF